MRRRALLPGGRPGGAGSAWPGGGAVILAGALALALSSVRLAAGDAVASGGAGSASGAASIAPTGPDSVVVRVERATRAEFFPWARRSAARRSPILRVTVMFPDHRDGGTPRYVVVGREANRPADIDVVRMAADDPVPARAGGPPPRRRPGEPAWRDPAGWNAWRLRGPAGAGRLAVSLDAARVDSLGGWIGIFDSAGRPLAATRADGAWR
jgi:hypothetical protein